MLEAEDSEDLPLCVEGQSESRMRCDGACLNSVSSLIEWLMCLLYPDLIVFQSSEMCLQSSLLRPHGVK